MKFDEIRRSNSFIFDIETSSYDSPIITLRVNTIKFLGNFAEFLGRNKIKLQNIFKNFVF